jgi:hypothetical protein
LILLLWIAVAVLRQRIKELKNTLEEVMHEKGLAEMKASRLHAAEEELAELRTT